MGFWVLFMRSAILSAGFGLVLAGPAAASSIMTIDQPSGSFQTLGSQTSFGSVMTITPPPQATAETSGVVDELATASVGSPREDAAPKAGQVVFQRQADADAAWAKIASTESPSLLYYGTPAPVVVAVQAPKPEAKPEVAKVDLNKFPMVMRGGIEGDLFPAAPAADAADDKAATGEAIASAEAGATPAISPADEERRLRDLARKREATPSPKRQPITLNARQRAALQPK